MKRLPRRGQKWRHYSGTLYTVVGLSTSAATGNCEVIYYEDDPENMYNRRLDEWMGTVENPQYKPADAGHGVLPKFIPRFNFERLADEAISHMDSAVSHVSLGFPHNKGDI